jgi:hypothetical protein
MNPSDPNHPWARLAAGARRAATSDGRETAAPYGFSTRVVALAFAAERPVASLFERFSLRALGVASLLALVSVAANYTFLTNLVGDDDSSLSGDDPVAVLFDES